MSDVKSDWTSQSVFSGGEEEYHYSREEEEEEGEGVGHRDGLVLWLIERINRLNSQHTETVP